jgi:hypothetical protein
MPDDKRKYYVHIESIPVSNDLLDISDMDFIGWIFAYSRFVHKLSTKVNQVEVWPKNSNDIMNSVINLNEYYDDDSSSHFFDTFASQEARKSIVLNIRKKESILVKCDLSYAHKIADLELQALNYLLSSDIKFYNIDEMIDTLNNQDRVKSILRFLDSNNRKKIKGDVDKTIKKVLSWS